METCIRNTYTKKLLNSLKKTTVTTKLFSTKLSSLKRIFSSWLNIGSYFLWYSNNSLKATRFPLLFECAINRISNREKRSVNKHLKKKVLHFPIILNIISYTGQVIHTTKQEYSFQWFKFIHPHQNPAILPAVLTWRWRWQQVLQWRIRVAPLPHLQPLPVQHWALIWWIIWWKGVVFETTFQETALETAVVMAVEEDA